MIADTPAAPFELYLRVRDWAGSLRTSAVSAEMLTPAEERMLSALGPLWDASPEMVAGLRRFGEAVTGVSAADYLLPTDELQRPLEGELRRLLARGDRALWVDEPEGLGGFGLRTRVGLYNEDTLLRFRVMSLLQDAGVLAEMRETPARPTLWEIGGGWGGFAFHLKSVCPHATYLATGHPELLLLAALYVTTLLPSANIRLYDPADPESFWRDWDAVDFAFAPEPAVNREWPVPVDVTIDLQMLERMSAPRIAAHVRRAYASRSGYFLSVCQAADAAASGLAAVRPAMASAYWEHPMSNPNYLRRRLSLAPARDGVSRTFLFGWRRLYA